MPTVGSPHSQFIPISVDLLSPSDEDIASTTNNFTPSSPEVVNEFDHAPYIPTFDAGCNSVSYHPQVQEAGCQVSLLLSPPVTVYKEGKKLTLPTFDPAKMSWTSFAMKLHASLIECDMAYLLQEPQTTASNAAHSKELMLELFRKLQGTAPNLFTSLNSQHYYLEGGRGIEMVKALVNKFHPLDDGAVQQIITSMQSLELHDHEDLSVYKNKLENFNLQLSWVGQEMSPSFLVFLAQSQLGKSCYAKDIMALQMSHTASGTSFSSLDDLCLGLECLDKLCGLPYGGAATSTKALPKPPPKKPTTSPLGIVTAVQESDPPSPDGLEFHKDSWVGAINLPEDRIKLLCQMFKCAQCHTNDHTLPSCPLMKH
jgi:hypothetical protein